MVVVNLCLIKIILRRKQICFLLGLQIIGESTFPILFPQWFLYSCFFVTSHYVSSEFFQTSIFLFTLCELSYKTPVSLRLPSNQCTPSIPLAKKGGQHSSYYLLPLLTEVFNKCPLPLVYAIICPSLMKNINEIN